MKAMKIKRLREFIVTVLAVLLIFPVSSNAFASQADNFQKHVREIQSKLKSTPTPLEIEMPSATVVGFPEEFTEDTFTLQNPITGESRRIYYISVNKVRKIECVCQGSAGIISRLPDKERIISVQLIDYTTWKGTVVEVNADSFLLRNTTTWETQAIQYVNVKKVDTRTGFQRKAPKIFIILGAAVVGLIVAAHHFIPYT